MNSDVKLFRWLAILIAVPMGLAIFGGDRFRYPCQDPNNWDKAICQKPACDVTRTCPEHVFKGQRDPRLGPPDDKQNQSMGAPALTPAPAQGVNCGK
jgi:hypothetical protein